MHAMVLSAPGAPLRFEPREDPVPGPGDVRVKVGACGVCRTDLHVVDGELPDIAYPIVPGHEVVGRVDALFFSQIEGHARDTLDAQCVAHFRADGGVWSDAVLRPIFPSALHQAIRRYLPHRLRAFLTGRRA